MKKVLTILLCAVLALSFIGVVDAAGEKTITGVEYNNNENNGDETFKTVTVSLNIDEEFTVTIPADFSLTDSGGGNYRHYTSTSVYITRIDSGKYLTVSIDGGEFSDDNGWYLKNGNVDLLFGIKLGPDTEENHISGSTDQGLIKTGSAIISTNTTKQTVPVGMHFKLLDEIPTQSGHYQAIIKFTVSMSGEPEEFIYLNQQQNSS